MLPVVPSLPEVSVAIVVGGHIVEPGPAHPATAQRPRKDTHENVQYYADKRHIFFDPQQKDYSAFAKERPDIDLTPK